MRIPKRNVANWYRKDTTFTTSIDEPSRSDYTVHLGIHPQDPWSCPKTQREGVNIVAKREIAVYSFFSAYKIPHNHHYTSYCVHFHLQTSTQSSLHILSFSFFSRKRPHNHHPYKSSIFTLPQNVPLLFHRRQSHESTAVSSADGLAEGQLHE